jgi:hypothetical protein
MSEDKKGCMIANSNNIADLLFLVEVIRTDLLEEMIESQRDKLYMQESTFPLWGKSQEAKFEFDKSKNLYQFLKSIVPIIKQLKDFKEEYRTADTRLIEEVKRDIKATKECMERMAIFSSGDYKKIKELLDKEEQDTIIEENRKKLHECGLDDVSI